MQRFVYAQTGVKGGKWEPQINSSTWSWESLTSRRGAGLDPLSSAMYRFKLTYKDGANMRIQEAWVSP